MKVLKNYLYNVSYQLLIIILPLITIPYISRVLGPNGVGINSYTNSVIQYFVLIGGVGTALYGNQQIAYNRDSKEKMSQVFWEIEIISIISTTLAYGLFLLFLLFTNQYQTYYLEQSILIIAVAFDISWFFMGQENFKATVTRNMLVKIVTVGITFWLVKDVNDIGTYILIISLGQLLGNLTLWPYLFEYVSFDGIKTYNFWRHVGPALKMFIPQIAIQVYLVLNKTMLGAIDGPKYSGFYDYTDKIVRIILSIVTASGTVMLPHVAHAFTNGKKEQVRWYLIHSIDLISMFAIPMAFGLAAVAEEFAPWFFGSQFKIVGNLIVIESAIIILIALSNIIGQQFLLPTNRVSSYTISVILGAIVNILLNIPLITLWGVYGAVIATVISEGCVTFYQIWTVRSVENFGQSFKYFPVYLIGAVGMFLIVRLLINYLPFSVFNLIIEVIVGIISYALIILILQPHTIQRLKQTYFTK